jgi:hypothetical protein
LKPFALKSGPSVSTTAAVSSLDDWQIHRAVLAFELADVVDFNGGVAAPARFATSEKNLGRFIRHALAPNDRVARWISVPYGFFARFFTG